MTKVCSDKACAPFRNRTITLDNDLSLLCTCKDRHALLQHGKPTGLTVTWAVGGWTLTSKAGVLASGGIDPAGGFSAKAGGAKVRHADQFELIGKVVDRLAKTAAKEMAA